MTNHPQYTCCENLMSCIKGQKIWHQKMRPPGLKVSNMLLEKSRGELPRAPEWMKRPSQRAYDAQFWMCLVMKVIQCCKEQYCDREAWDAAVHGVAESQTWLGDWTTTKISRYYKTTAYKLSNILISFFYCSFCNYYPTVNEYIFF